jgi:hypothetical protein
MEAVEKLYLRPGLSPGIPTALLNISNHSVNTGGGGSGLFRPGDFPWVVAETAIVFVRTLAACGGENGPSWAASCFPALHHLVPGAGQASKLLHGAYRSLRAALETAKGPEAIAAYPLATAKPPGIGNVAGAGNAQEQREPNTTTAMSAFSGAAAPPPNRSRVSASGPSGVEPSTTGARTITTDQTLTALAALPIDSTAPVTVLVKSVASAKSRDGRTAAICFIKDFSGPGGTEAVAKLAAAAPAAVAALVGLRIQPGGPFPVIRLTQVRLGKRAVREFTCGLTTNDYTIVEIEPQGHVADALRRSQGGGGHQEPAMSQEAECPAAPPFDQMNQMNLQPQTTQAAAALGRNPSQVYKVKSEKKSVVAGPSTTAPLLGQEALHQAHTQLVNMGFASEKAKAAVLAVMRENGAGWKQMTFEQFIDTLIQKASL